MNIKEKLDSIKNDDKYNKEHPHIRFRRKRTKSNIKILFKMLVYILLGILIVSVVTDLIIKNRVEKKLSSISENEIDEDFVILDYTKVVDKVTMSLVTISNTEESLNDYSDKNVTGVVLDKDGTIMTSYSKIKDYKDIYVKISSRGFEISKGDIILSDEEGDIALIKVNYSEKLTPINIVEDGDLAVGQGVALLSNSSGNAVCSIYPGIISSINNKSETNSSIEISGSVNEKNIGAVICNSKGELIGMVTGKLNKFTAEENSKFNYYVLNLIKFKEFIHQKEEFNRILGLEGGAIVKDKSGNSQGFYIEKLSENGVAQKSGLKPTDIIYSIDGVRINKLEDISELLVNKKEKRELNFKIFRNGEFKDIIINLNE